MNVRSRIRAVWPAMVMLLLAGPGCSGSGCGAKAKRPPADDAQPVDQAAPIKSRTLTPRRAYTTYQKPPPLPQQDQVELVAPGKAPRRAYHYQLDQAAREFTVSARVKSRELQAGAWSPRIALPEIRYGLGIRARAPDAGAVTNDAGTVTNDAGIAIKDPGPATVVELRGLDAHIGKPAGKDAAGARTQADRFLARYRKLVEHKQATATMGNRGLAGTIKLDAAQGDQDDSMGHEFQQLLLESVVPFPDQAIGKGARWRVITRMRRGPGVVTQRAEYELVAATPGSMRIKATLTQIGEHQLVTMPDVPAEVTTELVALYWRARGELQVSMQSLMPVAGTLDLEMRAHGRMKQPGGRSQDHFIENTGTVTLATRAR